MQGGGGQARERGQSRKNWQRKIDKGKQEIVPAQNIRLTHAIKFDTFHVALAATVDDDMPTKAGEASILARGGDIAKRNDIPFTSRIVRCW